MIPLATLLAYVTLFALLLAGAIIDIRKRIVPNKLVIGIAGVWLAWRIALALIAPETLSDSAISIVVAFTFGGGLIAFSVIYERLCGKEAIGGGDIKLLTVVCLFVGIQYTLAVLFVACLISLLYGFALRKTSRTIPMAPCICCAMLAVAVCM